MSALEAMRQKKPSGRDSSPSLAQWLADRSPLLYRLAGPPWRVYRWFFSGDEYWQRRQHLRYYTEVVRLARHHAPSGGRAIDVGAGATRVLQELAWFEDRVALDLVPIRRQQGVTTIRADFLDYQPKEEFDLVLCLQVLEHLDDPAGFAEKLFTLGRTLIISVPYMWPAGEYPPHKQDPVDEAKLAAWTCREPVESTVVADDRDRLIAVYRSR
jgi:SAM-dependent methyltransferase